jgi:hypothetical protein
MPWTQSCGIGRESMNRGCAQYTQITGVPLRASAVAVASGDYPTYTFTLRQGVQSHDGNELTSG